MEGGNVDVGWTMRNSTERFSDRAVNYARYRPAYPTEAIDVMIATCGVDEASVVADIGSGTGILTRQLLDRGLHVVAVEPNRKMRQAAEDLLLGYDRFASVDGAAEHTTLPSASVDLIVAAQAFHWFRYKDTRQELARIARPAGWLALVWNQRRVQEPLQREYEAMLHEHAPEYALAHHRDIPVASLKKLFIPDSYRASVFDHAQLLDRAGFLGRIQSSSYTPAVDAPGHRELMAAAELLFAKYSKDGRIRIVYDTELYLGQLNLPTDSEHQQQSKG